MAAAHPSVARALFAAALLSSLGAAGEAEAARCHVRADASGASSGSSWADAYTDLQQALAEPSCTDVWVAAGVYRPTGDPSDRAASFVVPPGVAVYGGFAGHETELTARDWKSNPTVLSGDLGGDDRVDAHGRARHFSDLAGSNSHTVVTVSGDSSPCMAFGTTPLPTSEPAADCTGGGVLLKGADAVLRNLLVTGNLAGSGGGIAQYEGRADYANLRIAGNRGAVFAGGLGMYRVYTVTTAPDGTGTVAAPAAWLHQVHISGNEAYRGAGIFTAGALYRSQYLEVTSNLAKDSGGGICDGYATESGVGSHDLPPPNRSAHVNLRVAGNASQRDGGGISSLCGSQGLQTIIYNGVITGNHANEYGGGLLLGSHFTDYLFNVVISGNRARLGGAAMKAILDVVLSNSVVWRNADDSGVDTESAIFNATNVPRVARSLVATCDPALWDYPRCGRDMYQFSNDPALLNVAPDDPLFVNPMDPREAPTSAGDYRFRPGSPLLDAAAADPGFSMDIVYALPELDRAGAPRLQGAELDLGPYEGSTDRPCPAGGAAFVRPDAEGDGDGRSWEDAFVRLQDGLTVQPPCELRVAAGVYRPGTGEGDVTASFVVPGGLVVRGGFPRDGGDPASRDWRTHPSILSGDLGQDDIVDTHGVTTSTIGQRGANAWTVVRSSFPAGPVEMDGLTVSGGRSRTNYPERNFAHNQSGAGMYLREGDITLRHLTVQGNDAALVGGGIMVEDVARLRIFDSRMSANVADADGSALFLLSSNDVEAVNIEVMGNRGDAASISVFDISGATSRLVLAHASLAGNQSESPFGPGAGLSLNAVEEALLVNSVLSNNANYGGIDALGANIALTGSLLDVRHSLVAGCNPGEWQTACGIDAGGNLIDADPLFLLAPDPFLAPGEFGDLHLQLGSPAIDAGDAAASQVALDLDGNPRVWAGTADLGAYERVLDAVNDVYATDEGIVLNVAAPGVLANDSDGHADALTATLSGNAANGDVVLNADGSFAYTPNAEFCGADSFAYIASASGVPSAPATVDIAVACLNDAPVAQGTLPDRIATEGDAVSYATASAFADPDGDTLTYSVVGLPAALAIDASTAEITGTIAAGTAVAGPYIVQVTATDGDGASATQSFTLVVLPGAPLEGDIFRDGFEG